MFNQIIVQGNLVNDIKITNTNEGKMMGFVKIGVYNGKDRDGNQRESMFFDLVIFGRDVEILRDNTTKGSPVVAMGRLEEEKTVSQTNGQTYINKKIVCTSVRPLIKPQLAQQPVNEQAQQQPQYTQQPQVQQGPTEYPW